jgi:hypothetical protein
MLMYTYDLLVVDWRKHPAASISTLACESAGTPFPTRGAAVVVVALLAIFSRRAQRIIHTA